jgi:hypothetical protein
MAECQVDYLDHNGMIIVVPIGSLGIGLQEIQAVKVNKDCFPCRDDITGNRSQ